METMEGPAGRAMVPDILHGKVVTDVTDAPGVLFADQPFEPAAHLPQLARLEGRLEDWMGTVDKRLDRLLQLQEQQHAAPQPGVMTVEVSNEFPSPRWGEANSTQTQQQRERPGNLVTLSEDGALMPLETPTKRVLSGASFDMSHIPSHGMLKSTEDMITQSTGTPRKGLDSVSVARQHSLRSLHRVMEMQSNATPKHRKRWKKQISEMRSLNAHHIQKECMDNVKASELNAAYYKRNEAVERALQKSGGNCTVERLVLSDWFDFIISGVLLVNGLLIGFEVEWTAQGNSRSEILEVLEWFCASVFAAELLLRVIGRGRDLFLLPGERLWAICDFILVTLSAVDFVFYLLPGGREDDARKRPVSQVGSSGRLLKVLRMFRIMRLLRMVRFLSELRVMAHMIHHSLMSLFWLFTLLLILIYIFSIVLMSGTTEYLKEHDDDFIREHFGSLFPTMYTLFQAMSGGVNWGTVATPLMKVGPFYFMFSLVYIFFSIFSVLNIVTGVFVDGAIELAKQDRFMMVAKNVQARDASAMHLLDLLREIDVNGDDTITWEEFKGSLERRDVVEYLEALSVDATEAELLFMLLDKDGNGSVDIEEFVAGMQRLSGEAKSFDVHLLMHANTDLHVSCKKFLGEGRVLAMAATRSGSTLPNMTLSPASLPPIHVPPAEPLPDRWKAVL